MLVLCFWVSQFKLVKFIVTMLVMMVVLVSLTLVVCSYDDDVVADHAAAVSADTGFFSLNWRTLI